MTSRIVFSDLDGTILAHDTFSFDEARPGLEALRAAGVPLILASSKTRRELESWRKRIGNTDPYIVENGGALLVPSTWKPQPQRARQAAHGLNQVEIGVPLARLRAALREISAELGAGLRGFGDLSREELTEHSGLSGEDLENALAREYDEPFLSTQPLTGGQKARLAQLARARWLNVSRGGRFYHLHGPTSKAKAAQVLIETLAPPVTVIAIGDAPNDQELLQIAQHQIVVARPDGTHAPELQRALPNALFTSGIGPAGFTEGVLQVLRDDLAGSKG
jgi:mannosyl-3-phosphoglycerate phosphatase